MLIAKRTLCFSSGRTLFSKIYKSSNLRHNNVHIIKFSEEEMLNTLSNTSIKPFLNTEKIDQIKMYYKTMNELIWPYSFVVDDEVANIGQNNRVKVFLHFHFFCCWTPDFFQKETISSFQHFFSTLIQTFSNSEIVSNTFFLAFCTTYLYLMFDVSFGISPKKNHDFIAVLIKLLNDKIQKLLFACTFPEDIVQKVLTNTTKEDQKVIIEGNPGLGLITINLINSGVPQILLFDYSKMQEVSIDKICEKYSDIIIRRPSQMQKYSRIVILSSFEYCYDNGVPVTIIGVCHSLKFLRTLIAESLKYHLWENKFSLFLAMGDPAWKILTQQENFKLWRVYQKLLFGILFSVEEIAKYPRSAFLPIGTISNADMHLIKVTHNPNFLKHLHLDDLNVFAAFVNILGSSKNNFIVPVLEQWIPNCGPYLISKGISVTNTISELDSEELLLLFNLVKEFEGYEDFYLIASKFEE